MNNFADAAGRPVVPRFALPTDETTGRLIAALTQLGSPGPDSELLHQLFVDLAPWVVGADGATFECLDGSDLTTSHASGALAATVGRRYLWRDSLAGTTLQGESRHVAGDTAGDGRADVTAARGLGIRTLVALPLPLAEGAAAVLTLGFGASPYDESRLPFLAPLLALGVARLDRVAAFYQQTESDRLLALVGDASRAILVAADPETELCSWACQLVDAPLAVLFERQIDDGFNLTAQFGPRVRPVRLAEGTTSIVGAAYLSGQLQTLADLQAAPDTPPQLLQLLDDARLPGSPSAAAIPLAGGDRPVGVLLLVLPDRESAAELALLGLIGLLAREAGVAIHRDHLRRELARQARSDDLTALANRRAWQERLELEMARAGRNGSPLCQVLLDLDHFKGYNDTHGHVAGDALLRASAAAWSAQIRETDLLARLGGEEFAVLLPDTPEEAAARIGQRLLDATPAGITASAGLAVWRGEELEAFYRRTDQALYAAKAGGRHQLRWADPEDPADSGGSGRAGGIGDSADSAD